MPHTTTTHAHTPPPPPTPLLPHTHTHTHTHTRTHTHTHAHTPTDEYACTCLGAIKRSHGMIKEPALLTVDHDSYLTEYVLWRIDHVTQASRHSLLAVEQGLRGRTYTPHMQKPSPQRPERMQKFFEPYPVKPKTYRNRRRQTALGDIKNTTIL